MCIHKYTHTRTHTHTQGYTRSASSKYLEPGESSANRKCAYACHKICINQPIWGQTVWRRELSTIFNNPDPQGHYLNICSHGALKRTWRNWTRIRFHPDEHPNTKTKSSPRMKVTHTWQAAWTLGYNVDKALVLNTDQYLASASPEHSLGISAIHLQVRIRHTGGAGKHSPQNSWLLSASLTHS